MTINTVLKTGLGMLLAATLSVTAYADDNASADENSYNTNSQNNPKGAGRMSAGGGVQPADQYADGKCAGDDCPDESLQEDNAATDIPDDNTDQNDGSY